MAMPLEPRARWTTEVFCSSSRAKCTAPASPTMLPLRSMSHGWSSFETLMVWTSSAAAAGPMPAARSSRRSPSRSEPSIEPAKRCFKSVVRFRLRSTQRAAKMRSTACGSESTVAAAAGLGGGGGNGGGLRGRRKGRRRRRRLLDGLHLFGGGGDDAGRRARRPATAAASWEDMISRGPNSRTHPRQLDGSRGVSSRPIAVCLVPNERVVSPNFQLFFKIKDIFADACASLAWEAR